MNAREAVAIIEGVVLGGFPMCAHNRAQIHAVLIQLVEDEREACAEYVETWGPAHPNPHGRRAQIAADLRAGVHRIDPAAIVADSAYEIGGES